MLVDTHCHIHDAQYPLDADDVLQRGHEAGVQQMICVGTDSDSSRRAVAFAAAHEDTYAAVGIHPHEAKDGWQVIPELLQSQRPPSRLIAIGEIGLDYYYFHSLREVQIEALRAQLDLAITYDLPVIFHVRDAFDDFWPIFDSYKGKLRGVLHSFTDSMENMQAGIDRGLYIGVNGISTFTKDAIQQKTFAAIPLTHLLLETDAPFLTPRPLRGTVNEPAFVKYVAEHHASIRGLLLDEIISATTTNAHALFAGLKQTVN